MDRSMVTTTLNLEGMHVVRHLGVECYGLWILIGSLTGYFTLLDLGVGAAVGRNVAYRRAKGDAEGALAILSTALALLTGVGLLTVAHETEVAQPFLKITRRRRYSMRSKFYLCAALFVGLVLVGSGQEPSRRNLEAHRSNSASPTRAGTAGRVAARSRAASSCRWRSAPTT